MAYPYATLSAVKLRMDITDSSNDAVLGPIVDHVNAKIEAYTFRAIGSNTVTHTLDGFDALENQHCLILKDGVRAISLLQVAPYTGAALVTVPATDYFIQPGDSERQPGWPGFEVWMTNVPSTTNTYPYFPPGFANVVITYDAGWAQMPTEVREVAETAAVRAWQRRQVGEGDTTGQPDLGETIVFNRWERGVLDVYRWRPVFVSD